VLSDESRIHTPRARLVAGRHRTAERAYESSAEIPLTVDSVDWAGGKRARRIISSIQKDVDQGGTARVRQILSDPEEIYRIEVERPDMSYVRTTLMGRDALTTLLEETPEDVLRERFIFRPAR